MGKTAISPSNKRTMKDIRREQRFETNIIPHGFCTTRIEEDHYVYGGTSGIQDRPVLNAKADWEKFLPKPEYQNNRKGGSYDSQNCAVYGTHNALETLAHFIGYKDFPQDCSDRFGGVVAGTTSQGNSPHTVIEAIRKYGVIPESALPFSSDIHSYDEYFHPSPMSSEFLKLGAESIRKFKIGHEWVFNALEGVGKPSLLMSALQRGTVAISVLAWSKDKKSGLYRKNAKQVDNHWVQLVSFKTGKSWRIFDSYDDTFKDLEWDYNFQSAKIYYIVRKTEEEMRRDQEVLTLLEKVKAACLELYALLFRK